MSTQLTLKQLKEFVTGYVDASKIASPTYTPTNNNTAGLLDKIAKTITIDGIFNDPLTIFNGEMLDLAKNIEEYYANLIAPTPYDPTGAATMAPADLTYMKPCYSYTLPREKFKVTKRYNDMERAFTDAGEYGSAVGMISKRLQDSKTAFDFDVKKELLSKYAAEAVREMNALNADEFDSQANYEVSDLVKSSNDGEHWTIYIVVKKKPSSVVISLDDAITQGYIVKLDLVTSIAEPTDTATGEAFIKAVKGKVKAARFNSEGNSLNGNTIGAAAEGLTLVIKAGVMPSIEVDTLAGAFAGQWLAFGVNVIEVDDFGSDANGVIAMLIDTRGVKVFPSYLAIREQLNADGDFINYVEHIENTCFYSRNTFLHVFKKA